tara:strand:- start:537 stop:728 length:192 start_codon:yes stop_codon:yes gene_type:complete
MEKDRFNRSIDFLKNEIGLSITVINLGIRLSKKNNASLPITLWSYGIINIEELDRIYDYLWND